MNADLLHIQKLRALDTWRGPIAIEPLPGGITNRNFLVRDGAGTFVARLCEERRLLGIDRRNEVACQRAAAALGIAPEGGHHEDGVLISRHLPGRTLSAEHVREPAVLARLTAVLRRLHDASDELTGELLYFSPFQTARTYAETARQLEAPLPDDLGAILRDLRDLSRRIAPFTPALCHNDLLAANLLDDGEAVRVVDWEYAGVGHPLFDLANLAGNCDFAEDREEQLLAGYRGRVDRAELAELRVLRAVSLLREALWSAIQAVASDLDFDFGRYAEANLAAYREARGRLDRG